MQNQASKCTQPLAGPCADHKPVILLAYSAKYCTRLLDQIRRAFAEHFLEQLTRPFEITHFLIGLGQIELGIDLFPMRIANRLFIGKRSIPSSIWPRPMRKWVISK